MSRFSPGKQILICNAIFLAATVSWSAAVWAQDPFGGDGGDPFGNSGDPFGDAGAMTDAAGDAGQGSAFFGGADAAAATTLPTDITENDPDPVVRLIRASPPQTAQQWSDSLTWIVRIKRWDEAKRLLEELRKANWNTEQLATLSRTGGTSLWLRLRADEADLTEEQLLLVRSIVAAPGKLARDPAAIEGSIQQLASAIAIDRRRAQLRLQDGGLESLQRLTNHLIAGDTNVSASILASTIAEFGPDGQDALRAACLVNNAQAASRVYAGMAELDFQTYAAELASGLAGRLLTEETQATLVSRLSERVTSLPDDQAVHAYLSKRFQTALGNYQQQRSVAASFGTWVWRPSPNGDSVTVVQAPLKEQMLERAAQLAAHRMQLKVASIDDLVECGVVLLQRAYHLDPNLSPASVSTHMLASIDQSLVTSGDYWQQVFRKSDELQMHGAALRSLQLMSAHAAQGDIAPPLEFLSSLMRDSRPIIRYTALEAIAKLDPKKSFGGEELAVETAVEMAGLGAGAQALVIGNNSELRMVAADLLAQLTGQQALTVGTGRAALQALNQNQPIEFIVIADRVSDLSLFELVQRVRNTRLGESLPIAVLTEQLYQHERRLVDSTPGIVAAALTRDVEHSKLILTNLWKKLDTSPLSASERNELAVTAGKFLGNISQNPDVYAFYPLSDWSERLLNQSAGLNRSSQIAVLSAIGSPNSQQRLAEMIVTPGTTAEDRLKMAHAFGTSLRRFGTLLPRAAVQQTYDLYNQLGPSDPSLANSLGLVLDYIEAQAGQIPWPEAK